MPGPVSRTDTKNEPLFASALMATSPPSVNLMALPTRLISTWVKRRPSPWPGGKPGASSSLNASFLSAATHSHRQIIVLAWRQFDGLAAQHRQGAREARARGVRHDHVVDIAALGGGKRRQKTLLVFLGARGDLLRVAEVGAEDDLDRALGAHHRDLRRRPGIIDVAADVFG